MRSIIIAGLLLASTHAHGEVSAAEMLKHLESKDVALRLSADLALTYLASGIFWSNAHAHVQWGRGIYCAPENLALQNDQLRDMLKRVIAAKPYLGEMYAGSVLLDALAYTFPCKGR
jgi:hypothetical protein